VSIRNGTITGYSSGILYTSLKEGPSPGGIIQGMRIHGNNAGIIARDVDYMIIRNNLIYDHALAGLEFGENSIVTGNIIAGGGQETEGHCDSIFAGNVDADNIAIGVIMNAGTGTCIVQDNAID